jgi:hypothetical protein
MHRSATVFVFARIRALGCTILDVASLAFELI